MLKTNRRIVKILQVVFICILTIVTTATAQASAALNPNENISKITSSDKTQIQNLKHNQDQKLKAYFEDKYGDAINGEYNEANAEITKILVKDPNHDLYVSAHSVDVYYRKFYRNPFDYHYSDLTWDIRDSINVEQTIEGWLISIPLDWELSEVYYININAYDYALSKRIDASISDEVIEISPDTSYFNVNVNIEGANGTFIANDMKLSITDENGVSLPASYIYPELKIPAGKYNISVTGKDDSNSYSLFKKNLTLSSSNNTVDFNKNELSKIQLNLHNGLDKVVAIDSIGLDKYEDYYYSARVDLEGATSVYVNKDNYDSMDISYRIEADGKIWTYYISKGNIEVNEEVIGIDFGTAFDASISLDKEKYRIEDALDNRNLKIMDEYKNTLDSIYWYSDAEYGYVNGFVEFKAGNETVELSELDYFNYMSVTLPSQPGDYEVNFYIEEGPISITQANSPIGVFQSQNKVVFTYEDPQHSQYLSKYDVDVMTLSSDNYDSFYRSLYDTDRYAVQTEEGWEIRVYDLDWSNNNNFKIIVNASNTVFIKEITEGDVNNPIVLQKDASHVPLKVTLPFVQNKLYYQMLALCYVDEDGKFMDVGGFYNKIEEGITIPEGKYNIQVTILDKNYGYNLMKPKYNVDASNSIITFDRSDVVSIKTNIINTSNSSVKLNGMFPSNNDMWSVYHLGEFNGKINTFYVSKLDYDFLGFETKVDNEMAYTYYTPEIEVDDNTVINLGTKLEAKFDLTKTNYVSGEYFGNQFLYIYDEYENRIAYIRDMNYDYVGGSLEFKSASGEITKVEVPSLWYPHVQIPNIPEGTYDVTFKAGNNPLTITPATAKITIGEAVKDTTAPTVVGISPDDDAQNVSLASDVTVTFSEAVEPGEEYEEIKLLDKDDKEVQIEKNLNGTQLTINSVEDLKANSEYTVVIPAASIQDKAEEPNALKSKYQFSFNTVVIPEVESTTPENGEEDVQTDEEITVTFNMNVQKGDGFGNIVLKDSANNKVDAAVTLNKDEITIKPVNVLNNAVEYTVTIPKDAVKVGENSVMVEDHSFSFTTEKDKIAPTIITSNILNNAKNIDLNSEIIILFSETILKGKDFENITLTDGKKVKVPVTAAPVGNKLIVKVNEELSSNTKYTLLIPKYAVQDTSDNLLSKEYKLAFTTVILPEVIKTNPKDDYNAVKLNSKLDISFNVNIAAGTEFENIKLVDKDNNPVEIIKTIKSKVLTIKSANDLTGSMTYTVVIPKNSITDTAGNAMHEDYSFNFSTVTDIYPPIVLSSIPSKSGKDAGVNSDIILVFNENIKEGATIGGIELKASNKEVIPVKVLPIEGNVLKLSLLEKKLSYNTAYTLTVPVGAVVDESGLILKSKYTLSFKTMYDESAPTVTKEAPKADSTKIKVTSSMTVTFNKYINIDNKAIKLSDNKGNEYEFSCTLKNNILTITPLTKLNYESKITLLLPKDAVKNFDGTPMEKDYKLEFETEADKTAPLVISSTPSNNGLVLAQDGKLNFTVLFSEVINLKDASKITLTDSKNKRIDANISCSVDGNRLIIIVDDALADGMKYSLTVGSGALSDRSASANIFSKTYKLTFIKAEN